MRRLIYITFSTLVVLVSLGCDPFWEITGEIVVPAEQIPADDDGPLQVLITTAQYIDEGEEAHLTGPYRVGAICNPRDVTTVRDFQLRGMGCPVRTRLSAWVAPLELEDGQECEELSRVINSRSPYASRAQSPEPPEGAVVGTKTVFEGDLPCRIAREDVRLEIGKSR